MGIFKSAFILGSSSTIAKSICLKLAQNGCNQFHLVSRDLNKNKNLIYKLETIYGAKVTEEENNLLLNNSLEKPFEPKIKYYDLYLIAAGYIGKSDPRKFNSKESIKINFINFSGLIPWLTEITKEERINKKGSLWILSSVASDRGRPSNYPYGSSKAALSIFCEGLLLNCLKKPFSVRIIKAGYISTPMAKGAPKFLCTSPDKVANILMNNPQKRGIEYLPWWWKFIMFIVQRLPSHFAAKL